MLGSWTLKRVFRAFGVRLFAGASYRRWWTRAIDAGGQNPRPSIFSSYWSPLPPSGRWNRLHLDTWEAKGFDASIPFFVWFDFHAGVRCSTSASIRSALNHEKQCMSNESMVGVNLEFNAVVNPFLKLRTVIGGWFICWRPGLICVDLQSFWEPPGTRQAA